MKTQSVRDTLPKIILQRWAQALRVNTRADWRQMAELCGRVAINVFADHDYNPNNEDFQALCQLARVAYLRGMACAADTQWRCDCGALA